MNPQPPDAQQPASPIPVWCVPTPRGFCLVQLGAPSLTVMRIPGWCGTPSDYEGEAIRRSPTCPDCARKLSEIQAVAA